MHRLRLKGQPSLAWMLSLVCGLAAVPHAMAQSPASVAATAAGLPASDEELILVVRANGIERGEFTLLHTATGDFWVAARDFPKLKLAPLAEARREARGEEYFSLAALGATGVVFDAAQLMLEVAFPVQNLEQTRIDLSNRQAPLEVDRSRNSMILNYRASARQGGDESVKLRLTTELNVRVGEVLVRQEAKYDSGKTAPRFTRGTSQIIWDDRRAGTRFIGGDLLAAGSPFGTTFTGAGLSLTRLYGITPDVVRHPGAALQVSAFAPADVQVAVDGNTIYRTHVGPGPISLDNLFVSGGARTVRITVTDATGRRQVIDQPVFFTDSVLAKGLHEYNYFVGRRSQLDADGRWRYGNRAWQAFHRYGASDYLTLEAGGEGSTAFASGGFGASLRNDVLGLLSVDALASADREAGRNAHGWSGRYTYLAPKISLFAERRVVGDGFRTFATTPENPAVFSETRLGASTQLLSSATLSADLVRSRTAQGDRSSYAVRFSSNLSRRVSLLADFQSIRSAAERDWAVNVHLRLELEAQAWASTTFRAARDSRGVDLEVGRQLAQGEGLGYRAGITTNTRAGEQSAVAFGSANWNLKPVTLELNGISQLRGGRSHFVEAGASGAIVAVDGYIGATREVGDGFALARLGVPQPGVDIFLNNQVQGKTNAQGDLLIPQVGAFGRQDVSLDDKQLPMQYNLARKRVTIAPAYRSGTVVEFAGSKLRAVTGFAWLVSGSVRKPIASRAWTLSADAGRLAIDTASSGDFYLEDAAPGRYSGNIEIDGKAYSCRVTVPTFSEAVHELQEGIVCE